MNLFVLGLKSLWRERMLLMFTSAGLAAVLGPLLLFYGFKFGAIAALLGTLRDDPSNREVVFRGNYVLSSQDLERFRGMPEVALVLPATRTIAARMEFTRTGSPPASADAGIYPSAAGDPLLPHGMVLGTGQVALSSSLAQKLRVATGDRINGFNQRTMASGPETIDFAFTVAHVIPRAHAPGDRAYVTVDTMFALEEFLDGYALPERGIIQGKPLSGRVPAAANVRMYARTIEQVPDLDKRLAASGISVSSKAAEVEGILGLSRSLDAIFALMVTIGSVGYGVSLAASLLGNIRQQRRYLSLVRLMGAGPSQLVAFPFAQGLAISLLGFAMSMLIFLAVSTVANQKFAGKFPTGAAACTLTAEHVLVALAGTIVVVGSVTAFIGKRLMAVSPAEVLHEE